jgi:BirA family biotin operon repressor/biotin-[acetyl-CoA-carboxylase] ligase
MSEQAPGSEGSAGGGGEGEAPVDEAAKPPEGVEAAKPAATAAKAARPVVQRPESVGPEAVERFGRPMKQFSVAVSSEVMALAWANQENAPAGAAVVVDHEINPRGLHGRLWDTPPADTLSVAIVLRPPVSVEEGDSTWLVAGLAAVEGAEAVSGKSLATWWPDAIVDTETKDPVGQVRSEVQLGPGQVKSAVITVRLDMLGLGLDPAADRDQLCEAVVRSADRVSGQLAEGVAGVTTAYQDRCMMLGQRVKIRLRPKGETRGVARGVDRAARLQVESMSGLVERVGVDQLMELEVV